MKSIDLIMMLVFLALISINISAQTITVPLNDSTTCCSDTLVINIIENDSIFDVEVFTNFEFNTLSFRANPLLNDFHLTFPKDSSVVFDTYFGSSLLAEADMFCTWSNFWLPGSGEKYVGFRQINAPSDTTFGWIKMDFRESQENCQEHMVVLESAYNSTSNLHLNAGQKLMSTSIIPTSNDIKLNVYPNPVDDKLFVTINQRTNEVSDITIYNLNGKKVKNIKSSSKKVEINLKHFSKGTYIIMVHNEGGRAIKKIINYPAASGRGITALKKLRS